MLAKETIVFNNSFSSFLDELRTKDVIDRSLYKFIIPKLDELSTKPFILCDHVYTPLITSVIYLIILFFSLFVITFGMVLISLVLYLIVFSIFLYCLFN